MKEQKKITLKENLSEYLQQLVEKNGIQQRTVVACIKSSTEMLADKSINVLMLPSILSHNNAIVCLR